MNTVYDQYGENAFINHKRKHQSNFKNKYDAYQEKEREEKKNENDIVRH